MDRRARLLQLCVPGEIYFIVAGDNNAWIPERARLLRAKPNQIATQVWYPDILSRHGAGMPQIRCVLGLHGFQLFQRLGQLANVGIRYLESGISG